MEKAKDNVIEESIGDEEMFRINYYGVQIKRC